MFNLFSKPVSDPVRAGDLDATTAFLLRQCKSKDTAYKARAKAALAHISAARQLQALGYSPAFVHHVASQAVAAARG